MSQTQNLFSIAQQWNQILHEDRIAGDRYMMTYPEAELPTTYEDSPADISPLYRIFGFFELLQSSIDFKLIPKKEALEMFLYYFVWWDIACAKAHYPIRWDRIGRLKHLRREMRGLNHYTEMCEWTFKDLGSRLQKRGIPDDQIRDLTSRIQERLRNSK